MSMYTARHGYFKRAYLFPKNSVGRDAIRNASQGRLFMAKDARGATLSRAVQDGMTRFAKSARIETRDLLIDEIKAGDKVEYDGGMYVVEAVEQVDDIAQRNARSYGDVVTRIDLV